MDNIKVYVSYIENPTFGGENAIYFSKKLNLKRKRTDVKQRTPNSQ